MAFKIPVVILLSESLFYDIFIDISKNDIELTIQSFFMWAIGEAP